MGRKDQKSLPQAQPPSLSSSDDAVSSSDDKNDTVSSSSSDVPPPKPTSTVSKTPSPDSDSDSDSHTETSSSDNNNADLTNSKNTPTPTPITTTQPKSVGPTTIAKRPSETDNNRPEKKSKTEQSAGPATATPNRSSRPSNFQRLWTDDDEIVLLQGMIDYKGRTGTDPMSNLDGFFDSIKHSLQLPGANKGQIVSKLRRLKSKFKTKKKLSSSHDIAIFDLSKQIWGQDEAEPEPKPKKGDVFQGRGSGWAMTKCGDVHVDVGVSKEDGLIIKKAMKRMDGEERREFKGIVNKANEVWFEAYLTRLKIMEVATRKVLDGIRNA